MRRIVWMVTVLLIITALVGCAIAHELILKPSKATAEKGEDLAIELQSTHIFIVKEEVEEISRIKAGLFHDGKLVESVLTSNEPELRIDMSVKVPSDGTALIVAQKDGETWCITNEGGKSGSRKELEDQVER